MKNPKLKKKKKNLSFKLLSLKIIIPTKIVITHTRGHFYIIRETKYFNTDRYYYTVSGLMLFFNTYILAKH